MTGDPVPKRKSISIIACALLLQGCAVFSIGEPDLLADQEVVVELARRPRIRYQVALAPLRYPYKAKPLPKVSGGGILVGLLGLGGNEDDKEHAEDPEPTLFRPELSLKEKNRFSAGLANALGRVFEGQALQLVAARNPSKDPLEARSARLTEAESQGAQIVVEASLLDNQIHYLSFNTLGNIADLLLLFTFPPFHVFVPDETFEARMELQLDFYDVRDPRAPIWSKRFLGKAEQTLNEFEHGIVYTNPVSSIFSGKTAGQFSGSNWKRVYEGLLPNAELDLQRDVVVGVDQALRNALRSPDVRDQLDQGSPDQARLYTVIIGRNAPGCAFAEDDARELDALLARRAGQAAAHRRLLTGKVTAPALMAAIKSLRSKQVDRVLIYYAGQGSLSADEGAIMLADGPLPLPRLARSCEALNAGQLAFVLDTSFWGERSRARGRGRRSASDAPEDGKPDILATLARPSRRWQVLCAVQPGQVTGEYRRHGLLTGLLLQVLQRSGKLDLDAASEAIARRLSRRSEAFLGRAHRLSHEPSEGREPFLLTAPARVPAKPRPSKTRSSRNKGSAKAKAKAP